MHVHLEIVMPPTEDVEASVKQILAPFDENGNEDNEDWSPRNVFWDFWVIGGRWAGQKHLCEYDPKQIIAFNKALEDRKVTCSGVTFGKQSLSPESQIPMVDALWVKFFPDSPTKVCPIFKHYNDQYRNSHGIPDIMPLAHMPPNMTAGHVIIAGPNYNESGFQARYMISETIWNGVMHVKSAWDGTVQTAINDHLKTLKHAREEYVAKHTPKEDWIVVTVDYHS